MFAGRFKSNMDKKSRLVVPKPFRQADPHTVWTHGVLTSGLDGCLFLYALSDWEDLVKSPALKTAGLPSVEMMLFQRLFAGSGHVVEVDHFGRILVPQELREEAELGGECVWVGAVSRAELWSASRWKAYCEKNRDTLSNIWDKIAARSNSNETEANAEQVQDPDGNKG